MRSVQSQLKNESVQWMQGELRVRETVRHSHLWGARTPRVIRSSISQTPMTRTTVEDSVRDVLWLVGDLSMAPRGCARIHWHGGCQEEFSPRAWEGGRCRPGFLALGVGQLVIRTPWVALSVVSCVGPTMGTVKQPRVPMKLMESELADAATLVQSELTAAVNFVQNKSKDPSNVEQRDDGVQ